MSRFNAILFDLDGTLLDTAPDFIWCLNTQRARHNLAQLDEHSIRRVVSNGARGLVQLGFGLRPEDPGYDECHAELLELYTSHIAVQTRLFPGLTEVLAHLDAHAVPWGIVTNKASQYTLQLLDEMDLLQRCASVVCPDHVRHTKPDPEPVLLAAEQIGVAPQHCLYAGDHRRDIESGLAAGMTAVAARYGYLGADENVADWNAHHIIDHGTEFFTILDTHQPATDSA